VDEAVFAFEEIDEYNGRVFIADDGLEVAEVSIEFKKTPLDARAKADLIRKLSDTIKEATQVSMRVEEVPSGTLPRFEYKVRRWTDERVEGLESVKYLEK
jgi:phenylacetate-CoA ligase